MNTRISCLLLAVSLVAGTASATLVASESFATRVGNEGYLHNENFNHPDHESNLLGTTGFSADDNWLSGTALVRPVNTSLTHDLLVGGASDGSARLRSPLGSDFQRHSRRSLAEEPSGSTFYMSGLVSMDGDAGNLRLESDAMMGLSEEPGLWVVPPGFSLGLSRAANGDVHLAAFADGNTYTLGNALTGTTLDGAHMIVLQAELGQTPGANDTLTAWYALAGETGLTLGGTWSGINIADSGADLAMFGLRATTNNPDIDGSAPPGALFDEWRFGTTLDAVAIPEPGLIGLLSMGAILLAFARRMRND